jgi:adenine-specific DNA-methyltransferase
MATGDDIKLPLTSRDVNAERLAQFRELFPEASTEGKFDLKKLAQLLGEAATDAPERYGLSWAGKSEAIRAIQTTSPGTLLPVPGESWPPLPFAGSAAVPAAGSGGVSPREGTRSGTLREPAGGDACATFNPSENLIIEGDNLEVLKLLQGGYHGRVKMIYIDPPYNTGGEFIYPDNYKEGLADYLRFSGQVSGEGIKLTTNAETDGRYHSKWLTMIYPRLFLARNLLREDGVIFVSIDDHEVHNLRAVMNEIFGEENFVAEFIWKRRKQVDSRTKTGVSTDHEYCLCFRKSDFGVLRGKEIDLTKYKNPNNDPVGPWTSDNLVGLATKEQRPNLHYDLVNPATGKVYSCPPTGWRYSRETMAKLISEGRILWPEKDDGRPRYKRYLSDLSDLFTGLSSVLQTAFSADGTTELKEMFSNVDVMDFPKPVAYLKLLFSQVCKEDDVALDFFAGSGTTAQAVLELNAQDGGNRKFILVQLPEPTQRKDFPTIADITKERVRRVIKKLEAELAAKEHKERKEQEGTLQFGEAEGRARHSVRAAAGTSGDGAQGTDAPYQTKPDLGFKVFKLGSSNFKVWDAAVAPKDGPALAEQLKLMAHNVEDGRPDDALLYELVLKSNLPLTSKIIAGKIGDQEFYDVADGALAICLARKITQETLRGLMARKPKGVICLDIAFAGNDQLKANIVLEMKSHGIEFHTA